MVEPDFDDARWSVRAGRARVGDPRDGRRVGGVEDVQPRPARGRLEGAGQHLGEEARPAHAHHEHVVDAVDERVAARRRGPGGRRAPPARPGSSPAGRRARWGRPARACGRRRRGGATASRADEVGSDGAAWASVEGASCRRATRPRRRAAAPISSMTSSVWARPGNMHLVGARRHGHARARAWRGRRRRSGRCRCAGRSGSRPAPRRRSGGRRARATCGTTAAMPAAAKRVAQVAGQALGRGARARRRRRRRAATSAASPAAVASGFPDSVPAWYTGPSGATCCITSRRPP